MSNQLFSKIFIINHPNVFFGLNTITSYTKYIQFFVMKKIRISIILTWYKKNNKSFFAYLKPILLEKIILRKPKTWRGKLMIKRLSKLSKIQCTVLWNKSLWNKQFCLNSLFSFVSQKKTVKLKYIFFV